MNAKVTKTKRQRQVFRVCLRDGREFLLEAATWVRQLQPDDEIKFYDEEGAEVGFSRRLETFAVAPDPSAVAVPPVAVLQNDVKVLASRVDALERNQSGLAEMIEQAVRNAVMSVVPDAVAAAFAERGM